MHATALYNSRHIWTVGLVVIATVGLLAMLATPIYAADSPNVTSKFGLTDAASKANLDQTTPLTTRTGTIIGGVLSFIAVVFFILMLVSGVRWMLARGHEDEAKKALNTITAAIAGIIVVMGAYAITAFVLDSVKGGAYGETGQPGSGAAGQLCCAYQIDPSDGGFVDFGSALVGSAEECQQVCDKLSSDGKVRSACDIVPNLSPAQCLKN